MKNFLYYLSITVIIALVIYFFGVYLALIVIIVLIVYFHEEFFGLCIIVQFLFSIYMFLTNHETQVIVFKFTCLLSGMFCLGCTCNKFFGNKDDDYEDSNKTMEKIFRWSLGIFIFSAFYLYAEPSQKKSISNIPSVYYYSNYDLQASSSYRHSEPSSYAMPTKISADKIDFPAQPPETEKIVDTESAMPPQDKEENNKQIFSERSDKNVAKFEASSEEKDISASPTKIGLIDDWEYVTTDEYGNKYYINKNFGTYSTTTSFEGTVVSARFKKVLSNGGCEIEVPAYDIRICFHKRLSKVRE